MSRAKIDCEELLHGNPKWEEVVEFFKLESFEDEFDHADAIKKHLLTIPQWEWLKKEDICIHELLAARFSEKSIEEVRAIFNEWNSKLGFKCFIDI